MTVSVENKKKSKINISKITTGFLPKSVIVPLLQEHQLECVSLVSEGDSVTEGQVIAEVDRNRYGSKSFGAAKIHSPIPGKVTGIITCPSPDGKYTKAVQIHLGGEFTHIGKKPSAFDWKNYSPAMLLRTISDSGVINTFEPSNATSLEHQISDLRDKEDKKLIVRLFDYDPTCKADSCVFGAEFDKVVNGIYITAKVCECDEIIIAVDKNQSVPSFELENAPKIPVTVLHLDTSVYPAGGKNQLVKNYKKQRKLTVTDKYITERSLFTDAVTMLNVYNCAVLNLPVESVYVYVNGDCLQACGLLKVSLGTTILDIAKQCGGFTKKLGKVIINGMINGTAVSSLHTPVTKYVKSIEFSSRSDNYDQTAGCCLHCGKCRSVCSASLCPDLIYEVVTESRDIDPVFTDAVYLCQECGICSIACPSKLPLSQIIKLLKGKQ